MTATAVRPRRRPPKVSDDQLGLVGIEPKRDDLEPREIATVEAKVAHDDLERGRHALAAPSCECGLRAWGEPGHCERCGRDAP